MWLNFKFWQILGQSTYDLIIHYSYALRSLRYIIDEGISEYIVLWTSTNQETKATYITQLMNVWVHRWIYDEQAVAVGAVWHLWTKMCCTLHLSDLRIFHVTGNRGHFKNMVFSVLNNTIYLPTVSNFFIRRESFHPLFRVN